LISDFPLELASHGKSELTQIAIEYERDQAIFYAYAKEGYSLKEIGVCFGLNYSQVSRIVQWQRMGDRDMQHICCFLGRDNYNNYLASRYERSSPHFQRNHTRSCLNASASIASGKITIVRRPAAWFTFRQSTVI